MGFRTNPAAEDPNSPDYTPNPMTDPGHEHSGASVTLPAAPVFTGLVTEAGSAVTGTAISTLTPTSGTAFTPSATNDAMVYMQLNAAIAGSYTLTMGPTTGAEHTIGNAVAMVIGSDDVVTLRVPATWKVVLTATSVTIGLATIQTV